MKCNEKQKDNKIIPEAEKIKIKKKIPNKQKKPQETPVYALRMTD